MRYLDDQLQDFLEVLQEFYSLLPQIPQLVLRTP